MPNHRKEQQKRRNRRDQAINAKHINEVELHIQYKDGEADAESGIDDCAARTRENGSNASSAARHSM